MASTNQIFVTAAVITITPEMRYQYQKRRALGLCFSAIVWIIIGIILLATIDYQVITGAVFVSIGGLFFIMAGLQFCIAKNAYDNSARDNNGQTTGITYPQPYSQGGYPHSPGAYPQNPGAYPPYPGQYEAPMGANSMQPGGSYPQQLQSPYGDPTAPGMGFGKQYENPPAYVP